jgi:hypothetical protein
MNTYRDYIVETNRAVGDSIRRAARVLERAGLIVDLLPHKTTMLIKRPISMKWEAFKSLLASIIQSGRGSLLLFSKWSGRCWICSNRGNHPGEFVEVV